MADLRLPPAVKPIVEDLPPLMDRHADRPGLYVGLTNTDPENDFSGGAILVSADGGSTWTDLHSVMGEAIAGQVVGLLSGGGSGFFWDTMTTLTVVMDRPHYTLANEPDEDVAAGKVNWILVGKEIIGFANATPTAEPRTYDLTRLLRGRRNTEQWIANHAENERVLLLTPPSSVQFVETGYNDHLQTRRYRAVPFGLTAADSIYEDTEALIQSENVLPFSPILLPATRDADGNATIRWVPRSKKIYRLLGPVSDFNLECCGCEQYEVDIWNGARTTLLRTFVVLNRTEFVYTAARQVTDFGSAQANIEVDVYTATSMIGRGRVAGGTV